MPAGQLLLVNPRRKRRRRARAATPRRRRVRARRVNPSHRRRRRRAVGYVVGSRPIRRRKLNPRRHRVHARRRRHNPRLFSTSGLMQQIVPAAIGGAGAVALEIGLSYLPAATPAFLMSGIGNKLLKVGGAIALGMIAGKVLGREKGKAVAAGALTVVAYGMIRDAVKQVAPTVPGLSGFDGLSGDSAYNPAAYLQGMGAYMDNSANSFQAAQMGAYMTNDGM